MKRVEWNLEKDEWIKQKRGIGFNDVIKAIQEGGLLDLRDHPNQIEYSGQMEFVVLIGDYVYVVPFVEDDEKLFLKTVFPSRKERKRYLRSK